MCQDMHIREIHIDTITKEVEKLCSGANLEDGMVTVFAQVGQDLRVVGGSLEDAICEGVRRGCGSGNIVGDPLNRTNLDESTPAVVHYSIVEGHHLNIELVRDSFSSQNISDYKMLRMSDGVEGVKKFIYNTLENVKYNSTSPIVVGVAVGGTMEDAARMSKKALLRHSDERNSNEFYKGLEEELLNNINISNISGKVKAVNIDYFPTHISGLPVAVSIGCHDDRHMHIHL